MSISTTGTTDATQLLLANVAQYNMNPTSIQSGQLNVLQMVLNGQSIVDPTTPFVCLLEASATCTAGAIMKSESVMRRLYPKLALTQDDLFHHMADEDYIGIYATPAKCNLNILIPYQPLLQSGVYINSTTVQTVVIPRDSLISINGTTVCFCYPIIFSIISGTIVQVTYDTSILNPLLSLPANALSNSVINYNNSKYLQVTLPAVQINSQSTIYTISSVNAFSQIISYNDSYCYIRAYTNTGGTVNAKKWVEIPFTMSPIVYDVNTPTLLVNVNSNYVTITLPDIYINNRLIGTSIRVDLYTTKGKIDIDLSQLSTTSYNATWLDYDTLNINPGVKPLNSINDVLFYSENNLIGGSNGLTFDQIRQRVVYHVNSTTLPIRYTDATIDLATYGYNVQKLIDTVTDRVFIASKNLPNRNIGGLITTPFSCNTIININSKYGLIGGGYNQSVITHAVQRITILPTALYLIINGDGSIIPDNELIHINSLTGIDLCNALNSGMYMYSPFHYLIDYNTATPLARPYYLNNPLILSTNFITANTNKNYNITTISSAISLVNNNYVLTIVAGIPTGLNTVVAQLRYVDSSTKEFLYLNSTNTYQANTATFVFNLNISFDIDPLNNIEVLNMFNSFNEVGSIFMNLNTTFDLFFLVPGDNTLLPSNFDDLYSYTNVIGASYETITVEFGTNLTNLYCPVNTILDSVKYLTYKNDVYQTYVDTVYKTNDLGTQFIENADGSISFLIEHNIGDPVLDNSNNPIILHKAGSYQEDVYGNLISDPASNNGILQQIGITLFDAKYKYATASNTVIYANNIPNIIIGYLESDIVPMNNSLNERTNLYYTPIGEPNTLNVSVGNNTQLTVPSTLNISMVFYVSKDILNNTTTKANIIEITKTIITRYLQLNTISINQFTTDLTNALVNQVAGFDIIEFLPNGLNVLTMIDTTKSFNVGETLSVLANNTLEVVDNINIKFELKP